MLHFRNGSPMRRLHGYSKRAQKNFGTPFRDLTGREPYR